MQGLPTAKSWTSQFYCDESLAARCCACKASRRATLRAQVDKYVWVEGWSEEYGRPFVFNQESRMSTWDRPPDLAWRRVHVREEL